MAAKKATRLDPAFAADVAGVQTALAAWRKRRKPREPIPETLWHDIIRMAQIYQTSPVAQALRVNYTALKRRVPVNLLATPARTGNTVLL
jgi:hypothetical protein